MKASAMTETRIDVIVIACRGIIETTMTRTRIGGIDIPVEVARVVTRMIDEIDGTSTTGTIERIVTAVATARINGTTIEIVVTEDLLRVTENANQVMISQEDLDLGANLHPRYLYHLLVQHHPHSSRTHYPPDLVPM